MNILVTGHRGYIGTCLVPMFLDAGHTITGIDSFLFDECVFGDDAPSIPDLRVDIRDLEVEHLQGYDAVIHLAALSNDPLGDLNPDSTFDINHRGAAHVARMAKAAGVPRFLQSSSCSLYGAHGDEPIDENASFNPVTPYGESKVLAEKDISAMADDDFSPTFLRNATAYGVSPRLRADLVVNNLTGYAFTTGEVFMKSDGTPWRPLVHIADISQAFLVLVEADRDLVHNEAFNVGSSAENYRIRDVAQIVEEVVPSSRVVLADDAGPDLRNYRVSCAKIEQTFPAFRTQWTVRKGVEELYEAYQRVGLTTEDLTGARLQRIRHLTALLDGGLVTSDLRWKNPPAADGGGV
jgi:nucleoside-diphosphate-sugar epimerase